MAVPRPRSRDYDELRDALVDTAGRILASEGPQALGLRRVAEETGTSTTAVYRLFDGKQGLLLAMFRTGFARFDAVFAVIEPTDDPVHDLLALGRAYRRSARANPHLYELMFGRPVPGFVPDVATARATLGVLDRLTDTVRRCVRTGRFPAVSPEQVARQLHALAHGLVSLELLGWFGDGRDADAQWDQALAAAARGYSNI